MSQPASDGVGRPSRRRFLRGIGGFAALAASLGASRGAAGSPRPGGARPAPGGAAARAAGTAHHGPRGRRLPHLHQPAVGGPARPAGVRRRRRPAPLALGRPLRAAPLGHHRRHQDRPGDRRLRHGRRRHCRGRDHPRTSAPPAHRHEPARRRAALGPDVQLRPALRPARPVPDGAERGRQRALGHRRQVRRAPRRRDDRRLAARAARPLPDRGRHPGGAGPRRPQLQDRHAGGPPHAAGRAAAGWSTGSWPPATPSARTPT